MARQLCTAVYLSPLGRITLASEGERLVGLWFEAQRHYGAGLPPEQERRVELTEPLRAAEEWLTAYFAGRNPSTSHLPLAPAGTPFRRAVWRRLLQIPYGHTTTYGAISAALHEEGISASPRAVGGAVGHNPISIIIPCHRVLSAAPGSMLHYAAGPATKQRLLAHESKTCGRS